MLNSNQLRNHTFEKFLFEIPEYATVINYSRRLKTIIITILFIVVFL